LEHRAEDVVLVRHRLWSGLCAGPRGPLADGAGTIGLTLRLPELRSAGGTRAPRERLLERRKGND
jgi:hypothetical protein